MIIIPSLEIVVILVPRTGSGSLKRAVLERHPDAMLLYRHMEADGVPFAYDRWRRIGVMRHPLQRLWSLYKFCLSTEGGTYSKFPEMWERLKRSVAGGFEEWLLNNEMPFTQGHDSAGQGRFWPQFSVLHSLPENRKSQFIYLRPDLGTVIHQFDELGTICTELDVELDRVNSTAPNSGPKMRDLSPAARRHMEAFFSWDLNEWAERRHGARP